MKRKRGAPRKKEKDKRGVFKPLRLRNDEWRDVRAAMRREGYNQWAKWIRDVLHKELYGSKV